MTLTPNLRGILWMTFGMAGFAILDMLLKVLAGSIPTGQLLALQGIGGGVVFGLLALRTEARDWRRRFFHPVVLVRNVCEVSAAGLFVAALATTPLSVVAAIIQSNPILVTLGAAIWLREQVGPYRWAAIFAGLCGVLLVIQPWDASFAPASLLAVGGVIFLSGRDLLTRWVPPSIPTLQLGAFAMLCLFLAGPMIHLATGAVLHPPSTAEWMTVGISIFALVAGVFGTTAAMREGDVSAVTPFRYTRMLFALILAYLVFAERPDAMTLAGAGLIVGAGLFSLWREQVRKRRA